MNTDAVPAVPVCKQCSRRWRLGRLAEVSHYSSRARGAGAIGSGSSPSAPTRCRGEGKGDGARRPRNPRGAHRERGARGGGRRGGGFVWVETAIPASAPVPLFGYSYCREIATLIRSAGSTIWSWLSSPMSIWTRSIFPLNLLPPWA